MSALHFDRAEALKAKALRDLPPCPACGAPATQEFWTWGGNLIPVGLAECSAACWEDDPDRYLEATEPTPPFTITFDPEPIDGRTPRRRWWRRS